MAMDKEEIEKAEKDQNKKEADEDTQQKLSDEVQEYVVEDDGLEDHAPEVSVTISATNLLQLDEQQDIAMKTKSQADSTMKTKSHANST